MGSDRIWGYWDPIGDLTVSYNILHYLTLSYRSGYLTYRTDALVQTAKPTLGAYLGHHFFLFQSTEEHSMIWETAFLKIYLWPISVLIIHNISFITLICFIILPIYSATVDYFQFIVPLLEQLSWRAILTCFVAKAVAMVSIRACCWFFCFFFM